MIKGYHTDNGIFNSSEFMGELLNKKQKIRFSGSSASHQIGEAERAIKTIVTMAMDYSVWVYNQTPDMQSGLSTIEIWSRSRFEPVSETLSNCHVWFCPTYVLEPKLQNPGVKIP